MSSIEQEKIECDIAIIGGGIAGLWLLNRLANLGFNVILFEKNALGGDQTVASQGMIHGGMKYTLNGALTGASEAISEMPSYWQKCIDGKGDVDLKGVKKLSDHFYMWSSRSVVSKMTTFLASKAIRGRINKVNRDALPNIFKNDQFKGSVYKLLDMVLDVPDVIKKLAQNYSSRIFMINWEKTSWQKDSKEKAFLHFNENKKKYALYAGQFILAAGEGNESILSIMGENAPIMQRRPLHMLMVKHGYPHSFYGHCLGAETTPRLTISSHPCQDNKQVWYLGGSIAEKGVGLSAETIITKAKKELFALMPWVNLKDAEWAALPIERAEPKQRNFNRPDKAFAGVTRKHSNVIVAWPTKLTLCPNLADEVISLLNKRNIRKLTTKLPELSFLSKPEISITPWQKEFGD
ncbi:MAG: glycerol-3-phosphate dehydrogenase [Porticoccus sp.]|jgi:hypothetical protein|nr:glycerol-3-phosphate dehydrogenase [Porticoccus sp.]